MSRKAYLRAQLTDTLDHQAYALFACALVTEQVLVFSRRTNSPPKLIVLQGIFPSCIMGTSACSSCRRQTGIVGTYGDFACFGMYIKGTSRVDTTLEAVRRVQSLSTKEPLDIQVLHKTTLEWKDEYPQLFSDIVEEVIQRSFPYLKRG